MKTVFSLGDDDGRWKRLILAAAASIALHEILLGIVVLSSLFQQPAQAPDKVVAERITLVIHTPTPPTPPPPATPAPTPRATPTPRIAVTTKKLLQARPRAAAQPAEHQGGAAAPKHEAIVVRQAPVLPQKETWQHVSLASRSVQNGQALGEADGGSGTGGGAGSGNGGANGTDSGTGGNGTEIGMDTPLSPCGVAYFDQVRPPTENTDGSVYEQVRMRVRLRDGHEASELLRWYFYYPSASADPLEQRDEGTMRLQFPPHGYDLEANQSPAIVLAIKHTRPNGTTDLPDCPTG